MIELTQIIETDSEPDAYLTLPIDQRIRSRLRVTLDDGRDAGLFLPRGTLLRGGDRLGSEEGLLVEIIAADETVTTVHCGDLAGLARATYHLGNRHVPLQVEQGWLRYLHDHVLDDMLRQMGLEPVIEQAPFEPEAGAYQQAAHGHQYEHTHSHEHSQ